MKSHYDDKRGCLNTIHKSNLEEIVEPEKILFEIDKDGRLEGS